MNAQTPSAFLPEIPRDRVIDAIVVDDDDFDRRRIRRYSEKMDVPIRLHEVPSLHDMQEKLREQRFDLILLDYQLSDGDGIHGLEMIRETGLQQDAAVIMISGNERADIAASAFRHGCQDFVTKGDLSPEVMRSAVLRSLNDVSERRFQQLMMERMRRDVEQVVRDTLEGPATQAMLVSALRTACGTLGLTPDETRPPDLQGFLRDTLEDQAFQFK